MFGHIKYDEKYMPELFLTLPELQNEQKCEFFYDFIDFYKKTLKSWFGHIKYDEKYMPELLLTLPELQHEQNNELLTICWFYI